MLCGGRRMVTLPILYVFFSSCPTNLTFTGATTWSHSERVAYAAFLSGGEDAADDHVHTLHLLAALFQHGRVCSKSLLPCVFVYKMMRDTPA